MEFLRSKIYTTRVKLEKLLSIKCQVKTVIKKEDRDRSSQCFRRENKKIEQSCLDRYR